MNDRLALAIRLLLGFIFIYASIHKIIDPAAFAAAIYNYRILPDVLVNSAALVLPWIELIIGVCLIAGWWLPGAAAFVNLLFIVFTGALLFNLLRGLDISCGCLSSQPESGEAPSMRLYFIRDLLFLAVSAALFIHVMKVERDKARR